MNSFKYISIFFILILSSLFLFSTCKKDDPEPAESCIDGVMNQDETGIDCGGICGGVCPTCDDGIQNQAEADVDCGGPCPNLCFFQAPCSFTNNSAYLNHSYTDISCNPSNNTISGAGLNGTITIELSNYPTTSNAVNVGGSNSIVINDFVADELLTASSGKIYIEYIGNNFTVSFCDMTFNAPSGGKVTSGKITCLN